MDAPRDKERRFFEISLIVVVLGMSTLFMVMDEHGIVALNLFYLPIVLSGYFLGRSSAGILALLSVLTVTAAATIATPSFSAYNSPVMVGLALATWAAVLGLTAILMGTLCDQRARYLNELHRAYVGVVEVLSKYLQSANPNAKTRSIRVAEMSMAIAQQMKMSRKQVDDVRVAALLYDLENIEVTTQLVSRAVNTLETSPGLRSGRHTFLGTDLVQSLGSVLEDALPLVLTQDDAVRDYVSDGNETGGAPMPLGAEIILMARRYDALMNEAGGALSRQDILQQLRQAYGDRHRAVIDAMTRAVENRELAESRAVLI